MPTTTNYGWTTPADTDLVKDGAAAIRTLGSSIDTTLKTQIDAQIPDSLLTTTGDVIYASGASTPARLGIGSTGQVLAVSGGVPAWTTVSSGGMTSLGTGTLSGATTTISSIPSGYVSLLLVVNNYYVSAAARCYVRLNGTASGYTVALGLTGGSYAAVAASTVGLDMGGDTNVATTTNNGSYALQIFNYAGTNFKPMMATVINSIPNSSGIYSYHSGVTAAITSIVLAPVSGSWSGGTYTLYGVK